MFLFRIALQKVSHLIAGKPKVQIIVITKSASSTLAQFNESHYQQRRDRVINLSVL